MKILLDSCVWSGARTTLVEAGHEVDWVGNSPTDPGDVEILAHAARIGAVVVTLDKDFGELAVVRGRPHAGIVRIVGHRAPDQGRACAIALARYAQDLAAGALVTIEPMRVRIRAAHAADD